jgi:hypothetical protein
MPRIIVTAEVEDPTAWEQGFRTHGDLFRAQTCSQMEYSINGNEVAVLASPKDFDAFMTLFDAPDTAKAMQFDGVKRETVKVYVVDHVWDL